MTTYLDFPIELEKEIETNKELARAVNYAHGVCDSNSNLLFFCTMYKGQRYKTTQELKDQTKTIYENNVQEAIKNVGKKLVFVGMGMQYEARYNDDVCNHRIRTEIVNPFGRNFFIEVGTWGNELMRIDHVIDRDQENLYSEKLVEINEKIKDMGGYHKVSHSHPIWAEREKYQSQPYYWYKHIEWKDLNISYTKQNVLKLVNSLFDCNFSEIEVDYNHLTTDIYKSISPALKLN